MSEALLVPERRYDEGPLNLQELIDSTLAISKGSFVGAEAVPLVWGGQILGGKATPEVAPSPAEQEELKDYLLNGGLHPVDELLISRLIEHKGIREESIPQPTGDNFIPIERWNAMDAPTKLYYALGLTPVVNEATRRESTLIQFLDLPSAHREQFPLDCSENKDGQGKYIVPINEINPDGQLYDLRLEEITAALPVHSIAFMERWLRLTPTQRQAVYELHLATQVEDTPPDEPSAPNNPDVTKFNLVVPGAKSSRSTALVAVEPKPPVGGIHQDPSGRTTYHDTYVGRHRNLSRTDVIAQHLNVIDKIRGAEWGRFLPRRAARKLGSLAVQRLVEVGSVHVDRMRSTGRTGDNPAQSNPVGTVVEYSDYRIKDKDASRSRKVAAVVLAFSAAAGATVAWVYPRNNNHDDVSLPSNHYETSYSQSNVDLLLRPLLQTDPTVQPATEAPIKRHGNVPLPSPTDIQPAAAHNIVLSTPVDSHADSVWNEVAQLVNPTHKPETPALTRDISRVTSQILQANHLTADQARKLRPGARMRVPNSAQRMLKNYAGLRK